MLLRRSLLWATTLMTVVLTVCVMVSDLFLRTNPDAQEQGISPRSWDVVGTVMLVIWCTVAYDVWRYRWRE